MDKDKLFDRSIRIHDLSPYLWVLSSNNIFQTNQN